MSSTVADPPDAVRGRQGGASAPSALADTDERVVRRAQRGDVEAFEALVQRYRNPVFGLAHRMLLDRGDAEDVVQDTLATAWRALPTLSDPDAFKGWLYRIATRRCLSLLRTRARRNTHVATDDVIQDRSQQISAAGASMPGNPSAIVERRVRQSHLASLVRQLPDDQRACWVLRDLHHLSYDDVAAATDLSVSTVRGRIARARQNLARGMSAFDLPST